MVFRGIGKAVLLSIVMKNSLLVAVVAVLGSVTAGINRVTLQRLLPAEPLVMQTKSDNSWSSLTDSINSEEDNNIGDHVRSFGQKYMEVDKNVFSKQPSLDADNTGPHNIPLKNYLNDQCSYIPLCEISISTDHLKTLALFDLELLPKYIPSTVTSDHQLMYTGIQSYL